ncbi:class I SAM-dependent methyltransferase [Streptomyces sp. DASNCL29]|uniref:class I SAM-dependent methyltransferase n=1 Tax=Streptomyces sp. DASNCL29 TaxID=2583819 RepID=UPI00110FBB6F|nr:class I SAM-dependent methyltransferase [Streptomyces sp. DASNCL29]TMV00005.1 methyltransferase domain-containing protein [Streptomyces sp. DASNCL29]
MTTTTLDWNRTYRAGDHHKYWELSQPSAELVGFLAALGPGAGRPALDIGCGTGWDTLALAGAGYRATGVDISEEALHLARARAAENAAEESGDGSSRPAFEQADVRRLPFADASFDLLIDRGCLHHLGEEDRERYAREAARVLRPRGILYLRGSRVDTFPFKPLTAELLRRHFAPNGFEAGPLLPFQLQTDAMSLPAHACVLTRTDAERSATP